MSNCPRPPLTPVNSVNDRETTGYSAADYVNAIIGTLKHYDQQVRGRSILGMDDIGHNVITHLVVLEGGEVPVDSNEIEVGMKMGHANTRPLACRSLRFQSAFMATWIARQCSATRVYPGQ